MSTGRAARAPVELTSSLDDDFAEAADAIGRRVAAVGLRRATLFELRALVQLLRTAEPVAAEPGAAIDARRASAAVADARLERKERTRVDPVEFLSGNVERRVTRIRARFRVQIDRGEPDLLRGRVGAASVVIAGVRFPWAASRMLP